ncbi:MAG: rRNA maturation RNase YbeY [Pirellulaceae bacterium]|nr:rRNA maturation RNase YbeY [Pirellulaceae bacterium]
MPHIELEVEFHVEVDATSEVQLRQRFLQAATWIVQRFSIQQFIVSISVVDDVTIRQLNQRHLQHDWATDVLSFVFEAGAIIDGEIIVSWDTASRLSVAAGWDAADELLLYVLHGMLHLVGLDDRDDVGRTAMRAEECQFLREAQVAGADTYLARFNDVSY